MASTNHYDDHSPDAIAPQSSNEGAPAIEPSACGTKTGTSQTVAEVGFQPSDYSVVCGRSKDYHVGNRHFRCLTRTFIDRYSRAEGNKTAKSAIVSEIITMIRQMDGKFCKYKSGAWFEVGERDAREKVTSLLRDLLHTQYRSSNKAKSARRSAIRAGNQRKKLEVQKPGQKLPDNKGPSDDSSVSSSCWGCNKDSLGFDEHSLEYDYFDIEVF
jgi:hypothetical protein